MQKMPTRMGRMAAAAWIALAANLFPPSTMWGPNPAEAQGVLTVTAVSAALSSAIDQFKQAISQAGDELRSLGNSLQANAQNVLQDLDTSLKNRMDQGVDSLDKEERKLATDAETLTRQLQQATEAVLHKSGVEARQTIVEADIAAYDTLYSLPCRDQRPRIVAAFPEDVVVGKGPFVLSLLGNYLTFGDNLIATVDGQPAKVVEKLEHSLKIQLPDEIAPLSLPRAKVTSVQIAGLDALKRTLWFGLVCRESKAPQTPMAAAVTIKPPIELSLSGTLQSSQLVQVNTPDPAVRRFDRTGSDHCDDSSDVSAQYCTTIPDAIATSGNVHVESANCGSSAGSANPSGPRCVFVPGRLQGCGANRGPFHTWLGCNGRGWLKYTVTLTVTTKSRVESGNSIIDVAPSVSDRSWSFPFPQANDTPIFKYDVTVTQTQGDDVLNRWTVSQASPNSGPVISRVADGALSIRLEE
jgi:hypothetical protein